MVTKIVVTKMVTKMQLLAPHGTRTAQGAGVPVRVLARASYGHGVHPLRHFYDTSPGSLQSLCGSSIGPTWPLLDIYWIVIGLLLDIYLTEQELENI